MANIPIECPTCGWEEQVDEGLVGSGLTCRKCGASFVAEAGGTYDIVGETPARPGSSSSRRSQPAGPSDLDPEPTDPDGDDPGDEKPKSWLEPWPTD